MQNEREVAICYYFLLHRITRDLASTGIKLYLVGVRNVCAESFLYVNKGSKGPLYVA